MYITKLKVQHRTIFHFFFQKSATYTCQAQGTGATTELKIHVEVVNKTLVPLCPAEGKFGVAWQTTSAGLETIADCPFHLGGLARRKCRLTDVNTTQWLLPDFTGCLSSDVELIYNNVRLSEILFYFTPSNFYIYQKIFFIYF